MNIYITKGKCKLIPNNGRVWGQRGGSTVLLHPPPLIFYSSLAF